MSNFWSCVDIEGLQWSKSGPVFLLFNITAWNFITLLLFCRRPRTFCIPDHVILGFIAAAIRLRTFTAAAAAAAKLLNIQFPFRGRILDSHGPTDNKMIKIFIGSDCANYLMSNLKKV